MHPEKANINYLNNTMKKVLKETDILVLEISFSNKYVQNKIDSLAKENDEYEVAVGIMH